MTIWLKKNSSCCNSKKVLWNYVESSTIYFYSQCHWGSDSCFLLFKMLKLNKPELQELICTQHILKRLSKNRPLLKWTWICFHNISVLNGRFPELSSSDISDTTGGVNLHFHSPHHPSLLSFCPALRFLKAFLQSKNENSVHPVTLFWEKGTDNLSK